MRLVSAIYRDGYPFSQLPAVTSVTETSDPADLQAGDILVVWGGADISPSLYNKPVSKLTHADDRPSKRDQIEWALMQRAKELSIPIIGVCRGAQMLCVLAGGTLIQHVNNHGGKHLVVTVDGEEFVTNSIHHQMMYPWDVRHEMLCVSKHILSDVHIDVDNSIDVEAEPEYVYFPEVKGFAIQWHPEMMDSESEATKYVFKTIQERL